VVVDLGKGRIRKKKDAADADFRQNCSNDKVSSNITPRLQEKAKGKVTYSDFEMLDLNYPNWVIFRDQFSLISDKIRKVM